MENVITENIDINSILDSLANYAVVALIAATVILIIRICLSAKFGSIAKDKGYGFFSHFILCLLFGTVGYIAVCALPDKITRKAIGKLAKALTPTYEEQYPQEQWQSEEQWQNEQQWQENQQ